MQVGKDAFELHLVLMFLSNESYYLQLEQLPFDHELLKLDAAKVFLVQSYLQ